MLLQRAGLKVGDRLVVGNVQFVITAAIEREPDSTTQVFALGPRLLMSQEALDATGLVQPGSLVYHSYRIKMAPNADRAAAAAALNAEFPNAGWRIRQLEDAGQRTRDFLENTRAYLDLIGLSALLIGGLGIANAVRAHLEGKARVIAMLKCIGATSGQIAATNLITIGVMAAISIVVALAVGATFPFLFKASLAQVDVDLETGVYAEPLLRAAAFGALTAFAFSLPSLLRARRTKPAQLFRAAAVELGTVGRKDLVAVGLAGLALAALVIATAENKLLAAGFTAAAVATLLALPRPGGADPGRRASGAAPPEAGPQRARPALRARDPGPPLGAGRQHRALHRPRPHRADRGRADPGQHPQRLRALHAAARAELLFHRHPARPGRRAAIDRDGDARRQRLPARADAARPHRAHERRAGGKDRAAQGPRMGAARRPRPHLVGDAHGKRADRRRRTGGRRTTRAIR